MKKLMLMLVLLTSTLTSFAQFEQGKKYVGASFSGLGMSYSSSTKFNLGVEATGGYFVADCLLLKAGVGYTHSNQVDNVNIGAGVRYYFDQCGVSLGAGAEYVHLSPSYNDLQIPLEVGYHFFINRYITIEPGLYYKMSIHDFSNNSSVGLKIGFGFYF